MKSLSALTTLMMLSAISVAQAGGIVPNPENKESPTFMIGVTMEFGEKASAADLGLTAKVISTNRENSFVFGGGVSYFPWTNDPAGPVGIDISAGYNFTNITAMGGFDLLRYKPQLSIGYSPTEEKWDTSVR